jgi:hypothetical protein
LFIAAQATDLDLNMSISACSMHDMPLATYASNVRI